MPRFRIIQILTYILSITFSVWMTLTAGIWGLIPVACFSGILGFLLGYFETRIKDADYRRRRGL